jgi:hypothetical protein
VEVLLLLGVAALIIIARVFSNPQSVPKPTSSKSPKKSSSTGQFIGAIAALCLLVVWVGYTAFKTLPSALPTLTASGSIENCEPVTIDNARLTNENGCDTESSTGSKAGAAFAIATDIIGISILLAFTPKMLSVVKYNTPKSRV